MSVDLLIRKMKIDPPENLEQLKTYYEFSEELYNFLGKYNVCKNNSQYCNICQNYIKIHQHVRRLSCNCIFHKKCIDKYCLLITKPTCPFC